MHNCLHFSWNPPHPIHLINPLQGQYCPALHMPGPQSACIIGISTNRYLSSETHSPCFRPFYMHQLMHDGHTPCVVFIQKLFLPLCTPFPLCIEISCFKPRVAKGNTSILAIRECIRILLTYTGLITPDMQRWDTGCRMQQEGLLEEQKADEFSLFGREK